MSASMGEGHDGAARELVRRLEARGHTTRMVDFLDATPLGIGAMFRTSYELQLRKAPWTYQFTYRLWMVLPFLCRPFTALVSFLTARCQLRWIAEFEPDAVVTTYNLSSIVLARLRRRGRIDVPVVTYVTDFDVHPLWLAKGVDLALCVHPTSAVAARRRTGRPARATGPLVASTFQDGASRADRQRVRAELGLGPDDLGVLVVAGSWGVGDIDRTFDGLVASGRYKPVAACGHNEELRAELAARPGGLAIGWTDEMASLMAACDVLVQNAGGLTCMEAFAVGLPVVTYLPIPGHGRQNGEEMERAGVAAYIRTPDDLVPTLDRVTSLAGRRQVTAARAMFQGDPADDVVTELEPVGAFRRASSRRAVGGRRVVAAAVSLVAGWSALTVGVSAAAAQGIGVARPQRHSHEVFVGIRLGPTALADPDLAASMAGAGISAIVDGTLADHDPAGVRRLADAGVDVANGGWGHRNGAHWARAKADVVRACRSIQSANREQPCHNFVPLRRVDGFDLASARLAHQKVVANVVLLAPDRTPRLHAGRTYVLDARNLDAATVERTVAALRPASADQHLTVGRLADLR